MRIVGAESTVSDLPMRAVLEVLQLNVHRPGLFLVVVLLCERLR